MLWGEMELEMLIKQKTRGGGEVKFAGVILVEVGACFCLERKNIHSSGLIVSGHGEMVLLF